MENIIKLFLIILLGYFSLGIIFGFYFISSRLNKIDSILTESKFRVKLIVFPGIVATWPLFLLKVLNSKENSK